MNYLTEAEAKARICCGALQTVNGKEPLLHCLGSGCMAWQFVDRTHHRATELWSRSKNRRVNSAFGDDAWWKPVGDDANADPPKAVGYCGLVK